LNNIAVEFNSRLHSEFVVQPNKAGLMLVNGLFTTVDLGDSHINAIPCETINEKKVNKLTCMFTF